MSKRPKKQNLVPLKASFKRTGYLDWDLLSQFLVCVLFLYIDVKTLDVLIFEFKEVTFAFVAYCEP